MDEFQKQLGSVENRMNEVSQDYPDLSPESRRECQENLDKTIKTLLRIQKKLFDADKEESNPEANVVQLLGLSGKDVQPSDFIVSFENAVKSSQDRREKIKWIPGYFDFITEHNYTPGKNSKLKAAEEQHFLIFRQTRDARHTLDLKRLDVTLKTEHRVVDTSIKFVKPTHSSATRETYREIGKLIDRINEIDEELKTLGAVREYGHGVPKISSEKYLDKSFFTNLIPNLKRARAAGQSLDHHAYVPLRWRNPVDAAKLQEQITALYNEECDALIRLREFQLNGWEFEF